ncbi:serine hydrolase domain-containing protein [Paenirhodobacter populi]|uniref:Class A beta-lactamase-related serine hydrolase n=1 Tax=Paenirhodobacter populi TaxID=2306993 RepID=A0A443KI62_9RHOB|nr:serine hydrolase domain-containing protein [Sinirhodobacter populi]RWR06210.1 class A beta-lactamase-related serine hydrolase [Sinirhodobacter populi]RWR21040.1 class A beta-lactamase-related serine hydrolase [Sinirhodobacter populi]RWR32416.1 class A beta-lactamase-related serine hydrolase [Sinirhodobacter populi]
MADLSSALDAVLKDVTTGPVRVPGVVAMITDREKNIWEGAAGDSRLGGAAMGLDSVFAIFSTTKAIAGTAALQCVEEGLLDLDAPAKNYAPAIGKLQVLEGFDADGQPKLRAPKSDITTRQLLLHTAGFGYDFFNENYRRMAEEHGQPSVVTCSRASIETPLLRDPGEVWEYGTNIDWAGQVVEGIRGKRLGEVCRERIFDRLGMEEIGFTRSEAMKARTVTMHARNADGSLTPLDDFALPDAPEVDCGGHGLYSTVGEYMKFIRMWLNDGAGPNGRVLKPETVAWAVRNGLESRHKVGMLPGVIPSLSNDAEFFPGLKKGWSYTFMTNEEQAPTGRPKGAIGWAGLANLFYWIDRQNGIGGYWATQILPFGDATSFTGYLNLESAVYSALQGAKAA